MKIIQKYKEFPDLKINDKNDQKHPKTDWPTIASRDLEINNQKYQRYPIKDKPISDAKKHRTKSNEGIHEWYRRRWKDNSCMENALTGVWRQILINI